MTEFRLVPDYRTPKCTHDQTDGCYHCCGYCDQVEHRCGGCGEPLGHGECSGLRLGTCNECHQVYFGEEGDWMEKANAESLKARTVTGKSTNTETG